MSSSKQKIPKIKAEKPQTLIEKYKAIQKIGYTINTPYHVYCLFKECREISVLGSNISFGEDYMPLFRAREVIGWFVHQLGGRVQWEVRDE